MLDAYGCDQETSPGNFLHCSPPLHFGSLLIFNHSLLSGFDNGVCTLRRYIPMYLKSAEDDIGGHFIVSPIGLS